MIGRGLRHTVRQAAGFQPPANPGGNGGRPSVLESFYPPRGTIAGENVTVDRALGIGTVYACIRILAETVGSTPLLAYSKNLQTDDRIRAVNSPTWRLLHEEPNPAMSPTDLWTLVTTWLVGWGDAFIGKQFASNGDVVALWPIHPERVAVQIVNGFKVFEVQPAGGQVGVPKMYGTESIIPVMGQSFTGLRGASPLTVARNELAGSLAAQSYQNSVYTNSAVPRGSLESDDELSAEAADRLRADWNRIYGGSANVGKIAILEQGLKFKPVSMPMRDVQFVEQLQLGVQTIARIFRVPLSMIQADSPGGLTYRTAETENLQFLVHGVRPWYVRIEQALSRDTDLFPSAPVEYAEFLPDALLKVTTAERFAAYKEATAGRPWMLPSEVRVKENMPANTSLDDSPLPGAASPAAQPAAVAA